MVAQVDEQQMAVIALAVDPARQADGLADIARAQLGAAVGAIGVHAECRARLREAEMRARKADAPRFTARRSSFVNPRGRGYRPRKTHAYPSVDYQVGRPQGPRRPPLQAAIRRRGHRVHAREHLLARPVPDPGREHRGSRGDRSQGRTSTSSRCSTCSSKNEDVLKVFHAGGQDLEIIHNLTGKVPHPAVRHADRGDGARPRRADRLFEPDRIACSATASTRARASPTGAAARSTSARSIMRSPTSPISPRFSRAWSRS